MTLKPCLVSDCRKLSVFVLFSLLFIPFTNAQYLPLTGGNITGNLNVSGNIGIGTTNPVWKLTITSDGGNGILMGSAAPNPQHNFLIMNNISGGWNPITKVGDNLILFQGAVADGSNTPGLVLAPWSNNPSGIRITPTGGVGIGTADPGSNKLAVEGTICARKVVVTLTNPFPDYVFKKSYNLPSIDSLSHYIEMNSHLPEIPSADNVAKNGLDLGDNQAALLKKIEELTLYLIQQNREIKDLKEQNKKLEKQQEEIQLLKKAVERLSQK